MEGSGLGVEHMHYSKISATNLNRRLSISFRSQRMPMGGANNLAGALIRKKKGSKKKTTYRKNTKVEQVRRR